MKRIGQLDTSHAMYQRCTNKRLSAYERRASERASHETAMIEIDGIVPDPNGGREQKEAWMRDRQRQNRIGAEREKLRMPHPPEEIQQRWVAEGEK